MDSETKVGRPFAHGASVKKCLKCGDEFECVTSYEVTKKVYCGSACGNAASGDKRRGRRIQRNCKGCGTPLAYEGRVGILPCHAKTKWFCSYRCKGQIQNAGPRSPSWKGGIAERGKYWKLKAKKRDGMHCRRCGSGEKRIVKKGRGTKGKTVSNLHAHHIVPVEMGGEHSLDNLVTLCVECHRKVEKAFYKKIVKMLGMGKLEATRTKIMMKLNARRTAT